MLSILLEEDCELLRYLRYLMRKNSSVIVPVGYERSESEKYAAVMQFGAVVETKGIINYRSTLLVSAACRLEA